MKRIHEKLFISSIARAITTKTIAESLTCKITGRLDDSELDQKVQSIREPSWFVEGLVRFAKKAGYIYYKTLDRKNEKSFVCCLSNVLGVP